MTTPATQETIYEEPQPQQQQQQLYASTGFLSLNRKYSCSDPVLSEGCCTTADDDDDLDEADYAEPSLLVGHSNSFSENIYVQATA